MALLVFFLVGMSIWYVVRVLPKSVQHARLTSYRDEEIERTLKVLELDPSNSGTRAKLAGFLIEDGELEKGIDEYRTAIRNSPHGPFTTEWKRKLKEALRMQEQLANGEKPLGFNEWRVCGECQANVPVSEGTCPRCGNVLHKGFVEFAMDKEVQREVWREAVPIALVLSVIVLVFPGLPLEWKGTLIMSALMVCAWLLLKSSN